MVIEFLAGLLKDYAPGVYKYLKKKFKSTTHKRLFFRAFSRALKKALKTPDEKYRRFLEEFKKKIKKDKKHFLELFKVDSHIGKPKAFFNEINTPSWQQKLTEAIVEKYSIEKEFHKKIDLLVKDSLEQCQEIFLETIDGEQASKLVLRDHIEKTPASKEEEKKPKAKQIKILSIMASPEAEKHDYYIQYEKEQDTMLDAFKQFDRESKQKRGTYHRKVQNFRAPPPFLSLKQTPLNIHM